MSTSYRTIRQPSDETLLKEKGSKFFGYAFPVTSKPEVTQRLEEVRNLHHAARHHCYAYIMGEDGKEVRANDDGEPSNSAGKPILGQIVANELTNVLVVVVRYFGGTKLGVGGLIQAYKGSAALALEATDIITRELTEILNLSFDYTELSEVERLLRKHDLEVVEREMTDQCRLRLRVNRSRLDAVMELFQPLHKVKLDQES